MKRLFVIVFAALIMCGVASAQTPYPDYTNVIIETGNDRTVPPMFIRVVRNAETGADVAGITSGEAVSIDATIADGVTIRRWGALLEGVASSNKAFGGIAVTDIATSDSTTTYRHDKSWGYVAIGGYCLASIDNTYPAGALLKLSESVDGALGTAMDDSASPDVVAVLLETSTAGTKRPVWLFRH